MAGYIRQDSTNNIATGNVINAGDLDAEFDAVVGAFNNSTGHKHDGTAAEGAPITVIGPVQDVVVSAISVLPKTTSTLDLGSTAKKFKTAYIDTLNVTTATIGTATITTLSTPLAVASGGTGVTTSTGTGNTVRSASPTFTGTITAISAELSGSLTVGGTTSLYGFELFQFTTPIKTATATLTNVELFRHLIQYTGAAGTLTLPTGTLIDVYQSGGTDYAMEVFFVNTGSGTLTIGMGTGITSIGSMTVTAGTSGTFRVRRTATATYVIYRLA